MIPNPFIADLHIHSKYSRATARNLDLEHLYIWAQLKGITVVGTGDFTHPEWFSQLTDLLVPAEPGLYRLKPDVASCCDESVPPSCRAPVRFMLSSEISSIYKKKGATRKNHNLVFFRSWTVFADLMGDWKQLETFRPTEDLFSVWMHAICLKSYWKPPMMRFWFRPIFGHPGFQC
jgi:PHP family Zn ribbon phosphoesterase